jgi:hypothetical protein
MIPGLQVSGLRTDYRVPHAVIRAEGRLGCRLPLGNTMPKGVCFSPMGFSFLEPFARLEHAEAGCPNSPQLWFRLSVVIGRRR